jgi:hypothetical protein
MLPLNAGARISFEALRRDGYGVVTLDRPEPNTLTVLTTINGRKARLMVDTGWSGEGITVKADYGKVVRSPVQGVKNFGLSAGGWSMGTFQKGVAEQVSMGNVQMRNVPIYFGTIGSLQRSYTRGNMNVVGYLSSGFLATCSAIIDLHNLRLYLRPPGTGRRAVISQAMKARGLAEVPFTYVHGNCLVEVEINGARSAMFLDTGAYVAGVDERFLPQMQAKARAARAIAVDAAGVERHTKLTNLRSFKIGRFNVRAPDLRITKFGFYDMTRGKVVGLLGMDILGKNGTIIDFGQKKIYFYPL